MKKASTSSKVMIILNMYITDQKNKQHFASLRLQESNTIDNALDQLQLCEEHDQIDTILIPKQTLLFFNTYNKPLSLHTELVELPRENGTAILHIKKKTAQKRQIVQSRISVGNYLFQTQQHFNQQSLKSINMVLQKLAGQRSLTVQNIDAQKNLPGQTARHLRQIVTLINTYKTRQSSKAIIQDFTIVSPSKDLQKQVQRWKNRYEQSLQRYQTIKNDLISQRNQFIDEIERTKIQIQEKFVQEIVLKDKEIQQLRKGKSELLKRLKDLQFCNFQLESQKEATKNREQQISNKLQQTSQSKQKNIDLASPFLNSSIYVESLQNSISQYQGVFSFLKNILEMEGKKLKQIKKLYQFDSHNKTNFHKYIDGRPHFIVLIKTGKGKIIGGYSQAALQPQWEHKNTYLFSLSDQKVFPVLRDRKQHGITYDPFFINFGNQQLLIKSCSNTIHSGLGVNKNICFSAKQNYTYKQFLGEDHTQVQIQNYEVLQAVYQE